MDSDGGLKLHVFSSRDAGSISSATARRDSCLSGTSGNVVLEKNSAICIGAVVPLLRRPPLPSGTATVGWLP